jgi:4-alpha-glucanotransferase
VADGRDILHQLAAVAGVGTSYVDGLGTRREPSDEAIVAVLQALGHDLDDPSGANAALRAAVDVRDTQLVPSCAVVWDDSELVVDLRLPPTERGDVVVEVTTESGERNEYRHALDVLGIRAELSSESCVVRHLLLGRFDNGYHTATVRVGSRSATCAIIAAPTVSYTTPELSRSWGVFAPLYALHRAGGCGTGDLAALRSLADWTHAHGGALVGTLPLLASYLDEPFDPSPYSPVSRLFWNELYLDVDGDVPEAVAAELRGESLVDYHGIMAARRAVLERRATQAWEADATRAALEACVAEDPELDMYARFRAEVAARRTVWTEWISQDLSLSARKGDAEWRYHVYVQHALREGLAALDSGDSAHLYLDLPVGVSRVGYDTWRNPEAFMLDASCGAPPDALFTAGQSWGLPPLHPERARASGHRYFAACLRNHMAYSRMLRIDHIMGLHRIFCVPPGFGAKEGAYITFPAEEMYGVLCIESHRNRCAIAGEDLGTVPEGVRPMMTRHGFRRLHVAQFGMPWEVGDDIEAPPADSVASLNTHDTPTFAGWVAGSEIDQRVELELITAADAEREHGDRRRQVAATRAAVDAADDAATVAGLYRDLAASPADIILVTLEDLWLEDEPQNVPGTCDERPNWRRKTRHTLTEIQEFPSGLEVLRDVDRGRKA